MRRRWNLLKVPMVQAVPSLGLLLLLLALSPALPA